MNHSIEVHLAANIDKYKAGMDAAKQMGSDSLGFIATIFDKIKTMFAGLWDSFKSFFSGGSDKFKSTFGSISDSASGAFQKISGSFSGFNSDLDKSKAKMGETEQQSSSLASKIGTVLVGVFAAVTAAVTAFTAKGLMVDATFAGIATSSGIAASELSRFDGVASRSGMGVKELGASMTKFREEMTKAAAGDGGDVFTKMGVKVADSSNALLKTDDVLIEVSKKIAGMSTEAEKYAAAAKLGFDGKVQVLEDIAHATDLSARVTDDQVAAVKRLGAIWHEILPSGRSMWAEISDKLTNALTPAMTTASVSILESKNRIVDAFSQIYGGGSFLDKLGEKIRDWSKSASTWFAGVEKSATDMTISVMQYVAAKTGLGNADAFKPSGTGYVPGQVALTGDKKDPITTEAEKAAAQQFDQTNKSIAERIVIMKEQIKTGAVLSEGQRALLQLDNADLKLSPEKLAAAKAEANALVGLEKQFKDQQDAKAASLAASKKEQEQYASLISSIQSKTDANKIELAVGAEATESQKMLVKLNAEIASGKLQLSAAHEAAARAAIQELSVTEQQIKAANDYDAAMKAINAVGDGDLKSLDEEIAKQKEHNAEIGKTREEIELARQAQVDAQTADMVREAQAIDALLNQAELQGILIGRDRDLYASRLAYLDREIAKRQILAGLHAEGATAEANAQAVLAAAAASQQLADMAIQDWRRAGSSIADSLSNAFGTAGNAIGQMFKAYSDGVAGQLKAQKELAEAKKLADSDPTKIAQIQHAQLAGTQAQIKSYGDMAEAAQGFFEKGSNGYHAMAAATEILRVAEVGLSLVKGVNAVLTQGEGGDVYSAFGRMAAMAAIVAGLGVAISGAGGGAQDVAQERQKSQGTGTVLGDSGAKSQSIANAIKLSATNSSTQINYLSGMLTALQSIQTNITNFASTLMRTADVGNPNVNLSKNNGGATTLTKLALVGPLGAMATSLLPSFVNNWIGKAATAVFGGKQSLDDSGFTLNKSTLAAALASGVQGKTYADITTSGGWFHGDKHDTQNKDLSAEANAQLTAIVRSMADSVKQAGSLLGVSGDDFTQRLNSFVIDIGKVSLKGLSSDEQQRALEAVFSKLGDQMAQFGVAGLEKFQKAGEGYLETLVRVASDYAKVDASLQSIGKTFGSVGLQSIAAREGLIELLGGIDEFQSKTADYAKNFLTTAQQLAPVQKYVADSLSQMGLGWVTTRQQFASVVDGLDLTTAAGQQTYAALMNLEAAFAATHAAIVDTTKSAQDIADERKDLQNQYDQLTMTSAQLLAKQRDALDESNKALFDQVQAAQKVKDAQDAAKTSLGNFITQMKSFSTTAAGLNKSLVLGSLSTLTPEQQYAEARRQFELTRQQATAGDATAQGNMQSIEQTFLQLSQKINGGDSQYSSDLATVMRTNDDLSKWATQSVDVAQASLNALTDSSATLTDISATLKLIAQGGQSLPAATYPQTARSSVPAVAPIDYSRMGTLDMAPLTAEVKALREEVKGLRAEALKRTGDLIQANESTAQRAAEKVVEGVHEAVTDGAYAAANSTREFK